MGYYILLRNKFRLYAAIIYKKVVQSPCFIFTRNVVFKHRYDSIQSHYIDVLNKLREKAKGGEKISVAFYNWEMSKWKAEGLYRLLEKDERFDAYIVTVPFAGGAIKEQNYLSKMLKAYNYFVSTRHKTFLPYSVEKHRMLDKNDCLELNPDILFQMNCWHEYGKFKQFAYRNNTDSLQCYIPYAWMISNRYWEHFNRDFHNVMWRIFYETPIHVAMAKKHSIIKGENAITSGYPQLDMFFARSYVPKDVWKIRGRKIKRIIWAPHAFINDENKCSNFLFVCDLMLEIARKYMGQIQIAFKPHPELEKKLDYSIKGWNEKRRKAYYQQWADMPNTMICEGEYTDLFLTSDAIIHDCGSFTAEYLCTYKPMLFLEANKKVIAGWNECGKEIAKNIYLSEKGEKIDWFIKEVVINGDDYMKDQRIRFVDNYLKPHNDGGASVAIFDYLKKELKMD